MATIGGSVGTVPDYSGSDPSDVKRGRTLAAARGRDIEPVFRATLLAYGVPQPPHQAVNGRAGGSGGLASRLTRGRFLNGAWAGSGTGQGFVLSELVPFNVSPEDIRRYSVISFDVPALDPRSIQVTFLHGPATELAFSAGTWLEPYLAAIIVRVGGALRFQVKRTDGWKYQPGLRVFTFKAAPA